MPQTVASEQRAAPQRERPAPPDWRVRPAPDGRGAPQPRPPRPPQRPWLSWRVVLVVLAAFAINYWVASALTPQSNARVRIPYSPVFLAQVSGGNVQAITSRGSAIEGTFDRPVSYPAGGREATRFVTEIPAFADTKELAALLQSKSVVVNARPLSQKTPWWQTLLYGFGPTLLFVGLWIYILRRAGGGAGGLMSFGRSKAKRYEPSEQHVTFADVAGIDEAKAELTEIVDFLKNPQRYRRLGGRIPRGVLLSGPPGTGKTLLARAVAGEAGVPFFSMSASEFIEMIVGVGASRVRDLFAQAKASAPAADRFSYDEGFLLSKIKVALGGRVAEEIVYGEVTSGAEADIQQLTQIARHMVGRWGMSPEIGPVAVLPSDAQGPFLPGAAETSEETQRLVDREVRRLVETAHEEVTELLTEHRDRIESLTRALLRVETLDEGEAYAAAGVERPVAVA